MRWLSKIVRPSLWGLTCLKSCPDTTTSTHPVCQMCHRTEHPKSSCVWVGRLFRRQIMSKIRLVFCVARSKAKHTCPRCTERVFPRHMLVLLRHDGHWLQSSEDNWEGRMSAISKPIKQILQQVTSDDRRIKSVEETQGIITSKLSDVETKVEQSLQSVSEQMSQIQASHVTTASSGRFGNTPALY